MRRSTAGATAAAVGAATAVTALVIGTTTGAAAAGASEAFGVEVQGIVDPTPYVESDGTEEASDELAEVPPNDLLSARVLGVNAGDNTASAEVADVSVADQLNASAVKVSCQGDSRSTTIVGLDIPGEDFQQSFQPEANMTIVPEQLANITQITLNRHATTDDGRPRVDGIVVDLADGTQLVIVSSATCSGDGGADGGADGDADGGADGGPSATKPAPVTTGLPVTG